MSATGPLSPDLEKLLIHQAKLANLGECVAHLTHELNNPLAIINSKVEDMLRRVRAGTMDPARLEQDLRKVLETTDRINKVSKTFLHFSRKTSEADSPATFAVRQAIDDAIQICHHRLQHRQVEVKLTMTQTSFAQGRPWEITQILVNLIQNSADAVSEEPERWIEVKVEEKDTSVLITVTDSGRGIPPEIRAQIMKPFFTTKKAGLGSGIGLCLSNRLAQSNGGRLFLNETSARTQFVLEIPVARTTLLQPA